MLKTMQIYKKCIFWVFNVFRYFWIFLKIYQNMGQKLGSNKYMYSYVPKIKLFFNVEFEAILYIYSMFTRKKVMFFQCGIKNFLI
jgi:hypothetical protein